jgi:hypothetical protein
MPKPIITPQDRNTIDEAFRGYHSAQEALHQALLNQRSTDEIDDAVTKVLETRTAYHELCEKFFEDWKL